MLKTASNYRDLGIEKMTQLKFFNIKNRKQTKQSPTIAFPGPLVPLVSWNGVRGKHMRLHVAQFPGLKPPVVCFVSGPIRPLTQSPHPYHISPIQQLVALPFMIRPAILRHYHQFRSIYLAKPHQSQTILSRLVNNSIWRAMSTASTAPQAVVPASTQTLDNYAFPTHRLKQRQSDPERQPLVLVACGSFSPITYLHLRMFEMAADFAKFNTEFEIMGGYLSPVSDAYKKAGLASAQHR